MRVTRTTVAPIDLELVPWFRDQRKWEENFKMKWEEDYKKAAVEPVINAKDWPRTIDKIREFLASILGDTGVPLTFLIKVDSTVPLKLLILRIHIYGGSRDDLPRSAIWDNV
jgi:hypothetical protein